jgi:hypothetical protein
MDPPEALDIGQKTSRMFLDRARGFMDGADHAKVRALVESLACWFADHPASENNHHSASFGLLTHSFMVAVRFITHLRAIPEMLAGLDGNSRRSWILAGTAAAFLHDCGKLLDMEVRLPETGKVWDPMQESMVDFMDRNVIDQAEVVTTFRPGRGLKGHEAKGRTLIPRILPPDFAGDPTTKTLAIYDACAAHHELKDPMAHWPAAWLAALILASDREDCAADLKLRREGRLPSPSSLAGN